MSCTQNPHLLLLRHLRGRGGLWTLVQEIKALHSTTLRTPKYMKQLALAAKSRQIVELGQTLLTPFFWLPCALTGLSPFTQTKHLEGRIEIRRHHCSLLRTMEPLPRFGKQERKLTLQIRCEILIFLNRYGPISPLSLSSASMLALAPQAPNWWSNVVKVNVKKYGAENKQLKPG